MKKQLLITMLVLLLLALTACKFLSSAPTPTVISGPVAGTSATPTGFIPSTPVASQTAIVGGPANSHTALPSATATEAPSLTPANTSEPTATGSPEPPGTASSTPLPNPTPTAGTPFALVHYFRADVEEANPGDTVTLEWLTTGVVTTTLWHMAPTGQFGRFWDVDSVGLFEYQIDAHERNRTTFALAATGYDGRHEMATLAITLRCLDNWFFASAPDICPAQAALYSAGAEQYFEHGVMIWVEQEDRIYVLYEDANSPKWGVFNDEWDPGEPENDPTLSPPPGLFQPVRGFGAVWREQPQVRNRLGWAIAEESPTSTAVQRTSYAKYNESYLLALDGDIWKLEPERSGWEKIRG